MNLFLSFKKSILVNYAMLHGICIYSAILLKVSSHGKTATTSSTGVMAYLFYIFLITGNFTTNNLKQSFNIMNLRFNFTSNKSILISMFIFSKRLRKHVRSCCRKPTARTNERTTNVRAFEHDRTCFLGFFEKINLLIRRDLLEVKLNKLKLK